MNLLHLAHTVPFPPNKGEKIRAFQQIRALSRQHDVHLACFARDEEDVRAAEELRKICASVYTEVNAFQPALCQAALRFLWGASLNMAFYQSRSMRNYVEALCRKTSMDMAIAYALPMAPYAPSGVPVLLDMQDVESQKWREYSSLRRPRFFFKTETQRLQKQEIMWAGRVRCTYLTSRQETSLLRSMAGQRPRIECIENGVDLEYFDPHRVPENPELQARRYVVFVGTMDYFPNIEGACWFAREIFPELRRSDPALEFLIVGNRPTAAVRNLGSIPGVFVSGGVVDVRPYVTNSLAVAVPLRVARGIQNTVLESLALGKCVFTTSAVCRTFGEELPAGVIACESKEDFVIRIRGALAQERRPDYLLREAAGKRFSWNTNLQVLLNEVLAVNDCRDSEDERVTELCRK